MQPADHWAPAQLVGRRVAFKEGEDHATCWHHRNGLRTGVVLRVGQTLAQKAALLGAEDLQLPESLPEDADVPRLWVRADPTPTLPRGCEVAVERECLLVFEHENDSG